MPETKNPTAKPEDVKVTVAIGSPMVPGDPTKTVILGLPQGAWDYMRGERGLTHTIDLARLGFPIQIVIFAGDSGADIAAQLQVAAGMFTDHSRDAQGEQVDLGIKLPTQQ